jgi:NSS family neurotransmitter:Na+ symporter
VAAWFAGLSAALSFSVLSEVRLVTSIPIMADKTIFEIVDFVVGTVGIPLNAALMSLFAGWVISKSVLLEEMGVTNPVMAGYIMFILRYVSPIVIGAILVSSLLPA